jgi:NTE family protein
VAGALKGLLEARVHERFEIVGLSGTSGGALTAALAWIGLLEQARGDGTRIVERIMGFWNDLAAQTPQEIMLDGVSVQLLRLVESGMLFGLASSPTSPQFQFWSKTAALMVSRPEFTDLRALVEKHVDFAALPSLVQADSPVLLVGAADVLEGSFKTFSSARGEISADALLASAAVPNLFPAVWVDGHAYWDGIFSTNPPITAFLRKAAMRACPMPNEIWVIQVNPLQSEWVPEKPCDISDRRNQMAGNLSLQHEVKLIDVANLLIQEHAFTEEFRARVGLDSTEPIAVRYIKMSDDLLAGLDYPSKLSRHPAHIARLIADGETQAGEFLADLEQVDRAAQ